mmetsp:Transcript_13000/g.37776  ORF Transcript_13000/g.37776 Transcript_13000/m.37776 type:complete len:207 (-) Transcript_13000:322-942(-)|eukprot:364536-Chlamydomonas_euryale.AAC.4
MCLSFHGAANLPRTKAPHPATSLTEHAHHALKKVSAKGARAHRWVALGPAPRQVLWGAACRRPSCAGAITGHKQHDRCSRGIMPARQSASRRRASYPTRRRTPGAHATYCPWRRRWWRRVLWRLPGQGRHLTTAWPTGSSSRWNRLQTGAAATAAWMTATAAARRRCCARRGLWATLGCCCCCRVSHQTRSTGQSSCAARGCCRCR